MKTINIDGHRTVIQHHDAPEEYVEFLEKPEVEKAYPWHLRTDDSWSGLPHREAIQKLRYGDETRAVLAETIYNKIIASDLLTVGRNEIVQSIAGYVPNVPAVLAGHPETMFTRANTDNKSSFAPIKIYVDIGMSSGIELDQMIKRGIAILAFIMIMKKIRPIELYTVMAYCPHMFNSTAVNTVRVETNPLDLSRAVWMLTDNAMTRRLGFTTAFYMVNDKNYNDWTNYHYVLWGWNSNPTDTAYIDNIRKCLNLSDQDIFIKGGYLLDELMIRRPVDWVNMMVEKHKDLAGNQ